MCRNVCDIIMDYVSGLLASHIHCYVAACTEVQWSALCVCSDHYWLRLFDKPQVGVQLSPYAHIPHDNVYTV